jgi:hypothetical protein
LVHREDGKVVSEEADEEAGVKVSGTAALTVLLGDGARMADANMAHVDEGGQKFDLSGWSHENRLISVGASYGKRKNCKIPFSSSWEYTKYGLLREDGF